VLDNPEVLMCVLRALCHQTGYLQPLKKMENMSDDSSVADKEQSSQKMGNVIAINVSSLVDLCSFRKRETQGPAIVGRQR